MPSTGNPWLERNQREEKVAIKQSQALQHQMPFIHTLLLSILLFFLCVHLSSCGEKRCGAGKNPWDESSGHGRQSPIGRPYSPHHFPDKHLLWGLSAAPNSVWECQSEEESRARGRIAEGYVPWEPGGRARAFGKDKQRDSTEGLSSLSLLPLLLICTEKHRLVFSKDKRWAEKERLERSPLHMWLWGGGWGKKERGEIVRALCCCFVAFSLRPSVLRATTVKQKLSLVSNFSQRAVCEET